MLPPSVTEGQNGRWVQGQDSTLTFKSDAAFHDFIRVLVDGKELDASCYELAEDSIIVTLKTEYLATLTAETHTIAIQSAYGTASAEFTVLEKSIDNETIFQWIIRLLAWIKNVLALFSFISNII